MASPVDTSVKFFRNDFPGAPALPGAIGAGCSVLKACLVTGFGLRTAVSVVVLSGIATVTLASEALNPNLRNSVILVAGVTGGMTDLNGEQRVIAANTTTLRFATALADGTAAGTITVKTAPAGWAEIYSKTNVMVLQSRDVQSTKVCLRVADTTTFTMRVVGYESMSDVDTGLGAFPQDAQVSGGFWGKRHASGGTVVAAAWDLFADSRFFYYCPLYFSGQYAIYTGQLVFSFGDFIPARSLDPFAALLGSCGTASGVETFPEKGGPFGSSTYASPLYGLATYAPRAVSGLGSAVVHDHRPYTGSVALSSGTDGTMGVAPSHIDGKLRLSAVAVTQTNTDGTPRGDWPGAVYLPHTGTAAIMQRGDLLLPASGSLAGRKLYVIQPTMYASDTAQTASGRRAAFDITGPGRPLEE